MSVQFRGTHFFNTQKTRRFRDPAWLTNQVRAARPFQALAQISDVWILDLGPGTRPRDVDLQLAVRDQAERAGFSVDDVYTYHEKSLPKEGFVPQDQAMSLYLSDNPDRTRQLDEATLVFTPDGLGGFALVQETPTAQRMGLNELAQTLKKVYPPEEFPHWTGFSIALVDRLLERLSTNTADTSLVPL